MDPQQPPLRPTNPHRTAAPAIRMAIAALLASALGMPSDPALGATLASAIAASAAVADRAIAGRAPLILAARAPDAGAPLRGGHSSHRSHSSHVSSSPPPGHSSHASHVSHASGSGGSVAPLPSTPMPPPTAPVPPPSSPSTPEPLAGTPSTTGVAEIPVPSEGILATLKRAGRFQRFVELIETCGLTETLSDPGPFTVFAVPDDAMSSLPASMTAVPSTPESKARTATLLRHAIVPGSIRVGALGGLTSLSTLAGQRVGVSVVGSRVAIGGARVLRTFVGSSNGVVLVVDSLNPMPTSNLLDLLSRQPALKTFTEIVRGSDLASSIETTAYTVVAPTDQAFAALDKSDLVRLLDPKSRDARSTFARRYVVAGRVSSLAAIDRGLLPTLSSETLLVAGTRERPTFCGLGTTLVDLAATNGVLFGIDAIRPESVPAGAPK